MIAHAPPRGRPRTGTTLYTASCVQCRVRFRADRPERRFCSRKCYHDSTRDTRPPASCVRCGRPIGRRARSYCSDKCRAQSVNGGPLASRRPPKKLRHVLKILEYTPGCRSRLVPWLDSMTDEQFDSTWVAASLYDAEDETANVPASAELLGYVRRRYRRMIESLTTPAQASTMAQDGPGAVTPTGPPEAPERPTEDRRG